MRKRILSLFAFLLCALLLSTIATATPITLTFAGTASGTINSTPFSNEDFSFVFTSDTTALCTIGTTSCPGSDTGDVTTPDPTSNTFTIGSTTGELTGLTTPEVIGPAVFLNPTTHNVGIWTYDNTDWLVTVSSSAYTASYGLTKNLSVTGLSSAAGDAYGNETYPMTPLGDMDSTAGYIDLTTLSNVSFTEVVGGPSGPSGPSMSTTTSVGVLGATAVVPEPSTLLMFLIGAAGIGMGMIRRRVRS